MRKIILAMLSIAAGCYGSNDDVAQMVRPGEHHAASSTQSRPLGFRFPGDGQDLRAAKDAVVARPQRELQPGQGAPPHALALSGGNNTCGTRVNLGEDAITSAESFCNCIPPDGALAAGPSHVVVAVNTAMKIYDKTGALLEGPVNLATFLAPAGDALPNFSDPFVLYDAAADRFVIGMINYDNNETTSTINFAVSQTGDPTGAWHLYAISDQLASGIFDFPHAAIDGSTLYVTGNLFTNGVFVNARAIAIDLAQAYAGQVPMTTFKDVGNNAAGHLADSLMPAQNDGAANAMYFLSADNQASGGSNISVFRWVDPFGANSFALQGGVAVASYQQPPDPFLAGVQVATNDARDLAAYYYDGTIYGAHTGGFVVDGFTNAGVQWYQLGNLDGAPTLLQQGIDESGEVHRFFPTLALDGGGNMMLAYAYIGPASQYISIFFTARRAADAPGSLLPESPVRLGDGQNPTGRWGDYGTMAWDGSQFWHLMEYEAADDQTWSTWLSALSFTSDPSFDIAVSPDLQTVLDGTSAGYTVTADTCNGYAGTIDLTASGLPSTIPAALSPTSISPGGSSTLTLSPTLDAYDGAYAFTVTGTDHATGSPTASNTGTEVQIEQPCPYPNQPSPSSATIGQTDSVQFASSVGSSFGWNGTATFGALFLPSGATSSASPTSGGVGTAFTTTVTTNNTPAGFYDIGISTGDGHCTTYYDVMLQVSGPAMKVTAAPTPIIIRRGGTATYTVTVQGQYGFSGIATLSATGAPSASTTSFSPTSVTIPTNGSASSTFKIVTTRSTPVGIYYPITITATSGSVQGSAQVMLQVNK